MKMGTITRKDGAMFIVTEVNSDYCVLVNMVTGEQVTASKGDDYQGMIVVSNSTKIANWQRIRQMVRIDERGY